MDGEIEIDFTQKKQAARVVQSLPNGYKVWVNFKALSD